MRAEWRRIRLDRPDARAFLALAGVLVGVKLLFVAFPVAYLVPSQAALFGWPALAVVLALAGVGLLASRSVGIPTARDATPIRRLAVPALVGGGFGAMVVLLAVEFPLEMPHVPLPASIPYYVYGAVVTEVLLRLVPLPVVVWLVARFRDGPARQRRAFWAAAAITSAVEPLGLMPTVAHLDVPVLVSLLAVVYGLNLATALLFRRHGFGAAVSVRLGFYLVWHVVYGGLA